MKKKFNAFDYFIIVSLFLILIGIPVSVLAGRVEGNGFNTAGNITICINGLPPESVGAFKEGDSVSIVNTNSKGKIVGNVEHKPSEFVYFDKASGQYVSAIDSEKSDVTLTVSFSGYYTETGFRTMDNTIINAGAEIRISTAAYSGNATVVDISDKKQ